MPALRDLSLGQEVVFGSRGPVTTEMMARWAAGSGDFNPIHYDKPEAQRQGLPDVIIAGPMKMAMLLDCAADWAGGPERIKSVQTRYRGMDLPYSIFTFRGKVTAVDAASGRVTFEVEAANQEGKVNTTGTLVVELPAR